MKRNRELRAFIREVLTSSANLRESVDPDKITVGMKLSDKEGGTPVAVIVGFMNDGDAADIVLGTSQKTPIAKVYSQALGNKQLEIPALVGKAPVKSVTYNYDPVGRGVGRYLTVQEAKDSSFTYNMETAEGNWLATFLSAVGNIGASASVDTKSVAYALNVMDITREEVLDGSVSDGTFFNASQLFIPYMDKLYSPSFRYTQQAQAEKSTACLLTQQEFLNKLPAYVAYLSGKTSTPGSPLYLSSLDAARMNMCTQQGTQGAMYKIGSLVVSTILQRFGIPMGLSYGVAQILPAIGPMVYHAETGNVPAFAAYIFQIAADIAGSVTEMFTPVGLAALISDLVCSVLLDQLSSRPGFADDVKRFIEQKKPETVQDYAELARSLKASDQLDPQDLKSLVPDL